MPRLMFANTNVAGFLTIEDVAGETPCWRPRDCLARCTLPMTVERS